MCAGEMNWLFDYQASNYKNNPEYQKKIKGRI